MTPGLLRATLIRSSVYLTAYELLLQALIEQPLSFFADDFTAEGVPLISSAYREHVLSMGKHQYEASARWFQSLGVLTDSDFERLVEVRGHRNHVAHSLQKLITSADEDVNEALLLSIAELVSKIDRWWAIEIVDATSGEHDHIRPEGREKAEVVSGRMVVLDVLISVALGDEGRVAEFEAVYRQAIERAGGADPAAST